MSNDARTANALAAHREILHEDALAAHREREIDYAHAEPCFDGSS